MPGPYWVTALPARQHLDACCPPGPTDQRQDTKSIESGVRPSRTAARSCSQSKQSPTEPIDSATPDSRQRAPKASDVYWQPWTLSCLSRARSKIRSLAHRWLRPTDSMRVCSPPSRRLATLAPRYAGLTALTTAPRTPGLALVGEAHHEPTHGTWSPRAGRGVPRGGDRRRSRARLDQGTKHLTGHISFQAAHYLLLRQPFTETTLHVGFGALVGSHTRDDHHVQG